MTSFPRRLSVIVSADIVGYNRLIGADEEGTFAALKEHREAIDPIFLEDGGRIVKNTGDGLLLEFPSAFNAVHASLGVQRVMAERNKDVPPDKRLEFRVGMHLGDVLVEDEDASGDGISIAERLQEIADPGGICLSRAAHAAVHKDFDSMFPDGGSKTLKDIEAPVHVYKLAPEAAMLADLPAMTTPRRLLSLVVLPFVNSTGAARHDFLADSITDQLTSELPRIEDSFVVDRKTALAAAAFDDDLAALGRRLGIRHALRGSVRAGETGLRIDAKLIDTETGADIWDDHLDIAIGDPFVMQHDVNARLIPLVYTRLLAATGHAPQPARAPALQLTPVHAAQPLSIAPQVVQDAAPIAAVPVAHLRTEAPALTVAETSWTISTRPQNLKPRVIPPQLFSPLEKASEVKNAPSEPDKLAALIAGWPVLHRPSPHRPVPRLPAPTTPVPVLKLPTRASLSVIQPLPEVAAALASVPIIEPEPEIAAQEEPATLPLIIHPRTVVEPEHTPKRVVAFRPVTASQPAAVPSAPVRGPYAAKVIEMPTPPQTDGPEWRMPFVLRLFFVMAVAAFGGAVAIARLGFDRETVVAVASWILIASGLAHLTSVAADSLRSARLFRPAGPSWPATERAPRAKRVPARIVSVRAVLRSPRGISHNTQYAP